ncbi:hypothetical protein DFR52_104558 [Hoeflea marina]|uniref:Uncharacterized protein n=1 Tax=Hoeflea marina TaxID=274592 RepID=A0A317PGX0_9HYPH|nr:hypothetical protein [Hoeflea marina]PWV99264.1 hypothetical protein DFR52_104558 [Hoeflea marina]
MSPYRAKLELMVSGELDPAGFAHADHVGVAFEALAAHDFFRALLVYADGLKMLVEKAGVPEKFNATVTFAHISLIAERMHRCPAATAEEFLSGNPDLLRRDLLGEHYSAGRVDTELARRIALLPDSGRGT